MSIGINVCMLLLRKLWSFSEYFFYKYIPISEVVFERVCGIYIHENKLQNLFDLLLKLVAF
jgi:hypothetical protein